MSRDSVPFDSPPQLVHGVQFRGGLGQEAQFNGQGTGHLHTVLAGLRSRVEALERGNRRLTSRELVVGEREDKCFQAYDTWFALWRAHADLSVSLGMEGPNYNAQLLFYDQNKRERLRLGLDDEGNPRLVMFDAKEREIWRMPPAAPRTPKGRGKKKAA